MRFPRLKPEGRGAFSQAWLRTAAGTLDEAAREAVRLDLEARTRVWSQAEDGLQCLRTELMDSVDRELVHRAFLALDSDARSAVRERLPELPRSDADVKRHLEAGALRISALREWAAIYYRDRAHGDWFDAYRRAAGMRKASAVRDLERLAGEVPGRAQSHRDAAVHGLNASLRIRLLRAPPGVKIGRRSPFSRLRGLVKATYHGRTNSQALADERRESSS